MKPFLVLLAAYAPVAVVAYLALRVVRRLDLWPVALLAGTAPLEVYRTSSNAGLNFSLFRLALLTAGGAFALDLARKRRRLAPRIAVPFALYAALLAWQVMSLAFVTNNHSLAYRFIGQYASGLAAAFLITCYLEREDLRVAVGILCGASVLPLLAAAYRVFSVKAGGVGDLPGLGALPLNLTIEGARQGGSTLLDGTQRLNSTFADPNQFGFYIGTALLVAAATVCGWLLAKRKRDAARFTTSLALLASTVIAVAGSYSRGAWLLVAVGLVLLGVLLGRPFWTRRRAVAIGLAGVLAVACATPLIVDRLSSGEAGNTKSTQVHEHTMHIALDLIAKHPLIGVGLAGYGRYAGEPPIISSSVSTFLTVGAELGLVGLLLLVGAIASTGVAAVRTVVVAEQSERVLLAGVTAAFIALAVGNAVGEVWMNDFQWILFGVLVSTTAQKTLSRSSTLRFMGRLKRGPRSMPPPVRARLLP